VLEYVCILSSSLLTIDRYTYIYKYLNILMVPDVYIRLRIKYIF